MSYLITVNDMKIAINNISNQPLRIPDPQRCIQATLTNEGLADITRGERDISGECAEQLLARTKRRGRGKALKTLLAEATEAETSKQSGGETSRKRKRNDSSSEDDTPRRAGGAVSSG